MYIVLYLYLNLASLLNLMITVNFSHCDIIQQYFSRLFTVNKVYLYIIMSQITILCRCGDYLLAMAHPVR